MQSATAVSQQATQSVKIPSFWDRLAIKFCALFSGPDSKPLDKISDQFSEGYKPWDRVIDPVLVKGIEDREVAYKKAIKEVDAHPTPRLTELHQAILQVGKEIDSLDWQIDNSYGDEQTAYSYIGSGGCGYDGSSDRATWGREKRGKESDLSSLQLKLDAERHAIARDKGIVIPKSGSLRREVRTTVNLYRRVSSSIIQEQRKHPTMSVSDIAVLSMPLFLSDTEQKNLERFLQDAQQR